jgi:hypothetical protein
MGEISGGHGQLGEWGFCRRLISNGARACHVIICLLLDLKPHGVIPDPRRRAPPSGHPDPVKRSAFLHRDHRHKAGDDGGVKQI